MIESVGPSFLVLVLCGYVGVCLVSAAAIYWVEGGPSRSLVGDRYVLKSSTLDCLPFDPPAATNEDLRATQSGVFCPIGAAAPKTVRPGLVAARPHDRPLAA